MSLKDAVKKDIRRHLKYPAAGLPTLSPIGGTMSTQDQPWRMNRNFARLEWRMNALTPVEESTITGAAYGAIAIQGNAPVSGDQVALTLSGGGLVSPVVKTITAGVGVTTLSFLSQIVNAIITDTTLLSAGFLAVNPWGTGPYTNQIVPYPQCEIINPIDFELTMTVTGQVGAFISDSGSLPDPNIQVQDNPVITVYGYIPILNFLEGAIGGATQNLFMSKADVFTARSNEIKQRKELLKFWKLRLAEFMDVPLYDDQAQRYIRTL